jgi:hypothetical protein
MTWDWIDSMWVDESEWSGPDDSPTLDDDEAWILAWESTLIASVEGASSPSSLENAITAALSGGSSDPIRAEWMAETAALTSSSVDYWNENLPDWIEQFCDEDTPPGGGGGGPDIRASSTSTSQVEGIDPCQPDESIKAAQLASLDGGDWFGTAVEVGIEDLKGSVGLGLALVFEAREVWVNWKRAGREVPGSKVLVRYTNPTTKQMVVQAAKNVGRRAIFVGWSGAAIASASALATH